jgi:hypothetical protein
MSFSNAGYKSDEYAVAMSHLGEINFLSAGGFVIARRIPGTDLHDAMGPYPLLCCDDWYKMPMDSMALSREGLVSLTFVADPFGNYDLGSLHPFFDTVRAFKTHYVVNLNGTDVSPHHERCAEEATEGVDVVIDDDPHELASRWVQLYGHLVDKHSITGLTAFPEGSLRMMLEVPGVTTFSAVANGEVVSMLIWYRQGSVAYYHLGASSERGYELKASFALFAKAIEHYAALGLHWLDLGGGAGLNDDPTDGLARFKRGWATGTRAAWLFGKVLNREAYDELSEGRDARYFPAYRSEERK